jgi:hypothetical protein
MTIDNVRKHNICAELATFADDTAVMAVGGNMEEATDKLQQAINVVNSWSKQCASC